MCGIIRLIIFETCFFIKLINYKNRGQIISLLRNAWHLHRNKHYLYCQWKNARHAKAQTNKFRVPTTMLILKEKRKSARIKKRWNRTQILITSFLLIYIIFVDIKRVYFALIQLLKSSLFIKTFFSFSIYSSFFLLFNFFYF